LVTRPCSLNDVDKVSNAINEYFQKRVEQQEVRELKNGDKRVYRTPPSIYALCKHLGISEMTFSRYLNKEFEDDETENKAYNKEICELLADAKQRIIQELYEGVCLGFWNERVVMAQLQKFGVIGLDTENHEVKVVIQGNEDWCK